MTAAEAAMTSTVRAQYEAWLAGLAPEQAAQCRADIERQFVLLQAVPPQDAGAPDLSCCQRNAAGELEIYPRENP